MRRLSIGSLLVISTAAALAACSGGSDAPGGASSVDDVVESASITFGSGFTTQQSGTARAGTNVRVTYALDRLPTCRGDVGGGGPGWNITGYVSENGGPARMFEVTALSPDGKTRVTKPAVVPITQGGDAAFWFQATSRWGCSAYDSAFGQNYHLAVQGPAPDVKGTITFAADGRVEQTGDLLAGAKVRVRYEQDRLPQCRRQELGHPAWTITGYASHAGDPPVTFQTGREDDQQQRITADAVLDLPREGDLALWFQVTSLGGCNAYDSKSGANYHFAVR